PVQGQVGDDAAANERREQGPEADLDDVSPEHDDHAAAARRAGEVARHGAEVPLRQHVRQRAPERREAPVGAGRLGEQRRGDLVGPLRDRDGLQLAEVRLAVIGHGRSAAGSVYSLSLSVTWPNENVDWSASSTRGTASESHMRASAFSAKMPPPLGMRGRITTAFHLRPATLTRSRPRTSTITGLRSGRK